MTSLICLVCRCNLSDGRLIREGEQFAVNEREAENLVRGGIARYDPGPEISPEPIVPQTTSEPDHIQESEYPKQPKKKRNQGSMSYV
jgi:hypothetical protein